MNKQTCKPDSVEDGHSSGRRITAALVCSDLPGTFILLPGCPIRGCRAGPARVRIAADSFPIWSCSVWGLPCLRRYRRSGALLPHLFTLTLDSLREWLLRVLPRKPGRYVFCGTGRPGAFRLRSRMLSGTLPCGVRTFLCGFACAPPQRPSGLPAASILAGLDASPEGLCADSGAGTAGVTGTGWSATWQSSSE